MSSGNDLKLIVVIQFVAETCVFRAALVWMGAADQQPPCCVVGAFDIVVCSQEEKLTGRAGRRRLEATFLCFL